MKKFMSLFFAGCLLLTACSPSAKAVTVESNVTDFNMNDYEMPEEVTIESGQLLYNKDGLKITTDSLESDSAETFLILSIENTSDTDFSLTCESAAINNFMISSLFNAELPAGETILTGISFNNTDLNACEIKTIAEISFTLSVYDAETYTYLCDTDYMHIQTSQYGKYNQSVNTSGTTVYEKNNIQIISKGFTTDENWGDVIVLLIINQSEKNIYFGLDNGTAIADNTEYEVSFGCNVPANCNAIRYIYFQDNEGSGISDISTASVVFSLTDTDSWSAIDKTPEIIFSK